MKTLTIDFDTYKEELAASFRQGFKEGLGDARRIFLELLAGASIESLDIGDDERLYKLALDLKPRIDLLLKNST